MAEISDQKRKELIRALMEEKRGYVMRGDLDSAALVDEELKRLGAEGKPPAKRATRRKADG